MSHTCDACEAVARNFIAQWNAVVMERGRELVEAHVAKAERVRKAQAAG